MTGTPVVWPTPDLVAHRARTAPERVALVDAASGEAWTYAELDDGPVDALAAGLRARGLEPGAHLGVVAPPSPRLAQLVHAAARAGLRLVPLPPDAPQDELRRRCRAADVEAIVVGERATDLDDAAPRVIELAGLPAPPDGRSPHAWGPQDVQWLVFTSGTTGRPRPVALTAGNLVASATASARRLGVEPDDRWLSPLPMHHVGGLAPLVRSARYGTAAVVQSGFDAPATIEAVAAHDVTAVSLVPTMLTRLLEDGWSPPGSLRVALLGGAPSSRELVERAMSAGVPVHPTYGMTEAASQVATARPGEAAAHPGTVGRPLAGTTVRVLDADGAPAPAGEPGELVVSGPTVSPGYYGDDAANVDRFDAGAFHTRDRGYRDAAGRLWVVGRLDDAIQTGGETVQPDAVEAALREDPAVTDAAVVGLDHDEWGQALAALVVPAGDELDAAAVRDRAGERLAPHTVPKLVVAADALPRTASGTVDREAVRDRLRAVRRDGL